MLSSLLPRLVTPKSEYACCSRFMEQRYVRVLNVGKRSCKFGKKSPARWRALKKSQLFNET